MPTIQETAYPRLKSTVSAADLVAIYTPTPEDQSLAKQITRGKPAYLGFLILLKTFQRLGYFVPVKQVPAAIVEHIAAVTESEEAVADLENYDLSKTRKRHTHAIRDSLQIQFFGKEARHIMIVAMSEAATTKDELADLINVAIEELVRKKYELPAFNALVRGARHARSIIYQQYYQQVAAMLSTEEKALIDALFVAEPESPLHPVEQPQARTGKPDTDPSESLAGPASVAGRVPPRPTGVGQYP